MTPAYYNEIDPYPAQWLRNLIAAGHLPGGEVDERDIREVSADDLKGYGECHFFAGIGGWPLALRWAGWEGPVWTGSCPCQPLSSAGQRKGHADERHLWPAFHALIAERRPATVFGEQVAGRLGYEWLAGVRADMEATKYAVGAATLPACCKGAPHIRERIFWLADAGYSERGPGDRPRDDGRRDVLRQEREEGSAVAGQCGPHGRQPGNGGLQPGKEHEQQPEDGGAGGVGEPDCRGSQARKQAAATVGQGHSAEPASGDGRLADSERAGLEGREVESARQEQPAAERSGGTGFWSAFDPIPCSDGKARRIEPGTFPLAHGVPNRVGRLRAYGNAIVPQVAQAFIEAVMECRP